LLDIIVVIITTIIHRRKKMKKRIFFAVVISAALLISSLSAAAAETPEQVYGKVCNAIKAKDFEGLLKLVSENARGKMLESSVQERFQILSFLSDNLPGDLKVTKRDVREKEAVLYVEGTGKSVFTGKVDKVYGMVYFIKENQIWKFDSEVWQYEPF
jgi:hypothetical protein